MFNANVRIAGVVVVAMTFAIGCTGDQGSGNADNAAGSDQSSGGVGGNVSQSGSSSGSSGGAAGGAAGGSDNAAGSGGQASVVDQCFTLVGNICKRRVNCDFIDADQETACVDSFSCENTESVSDNYQACMQDVDAISCFSFGQGPSAACVNVIIPKPTEAEIKCRQFVSTLCGRLVECRELPDVEAEMASCEAAYNFFVGCDNANQVPMTHDMCIDDLGTAKCSELYPFGLSGGVNPPVNCGGSEIELPDASMDNMDDMDAGAPDGGAESDDDNVNSARYPVLDRLPPFETLQSPAPQWSRVRKVVGLPR